MKRALLIGALWLAATAATGAVAWGAVRLAGEQTAEEAMRPLTAHQVEALAVSSTTGAAAGTSTRPVTTSAVSTTGPGATTTAAATTTTAAGTATTTTTGTEANPVVAARRTPGGTVVVSLQGERLSLASATPAAGFSVEVEEAGPDEVVVVFEGGEGEEIRVRASAEDDEILFEVEIGEDD